MIVNRIDRRPNRYVNPYTGGFWHEWSRDLVGLGAVVGMLLGLFSV